MDKLLGFCCRADGANLAYALHLTKKIIYRCNYGMSEQFAKYLFDDTIIDLCYCCITTIKQSSDDTTKVGIDRVRALEVLRAVVWLHDKRYS